MKYLVLWICFLALPSMAQTCLADFDETATGLIDNNNGTITDSRLGLTWMRCSLGQTWNAEFNSCTGDASELTWQQALQMAHGFEFADQAGWRVPNVKELATLTERQCVRPAINELFFPNTPSDDFWTSTPSVLDPQRAWVVAFFNSSNSIKDKNLFVFTRLVKNTE